MICQNCGHEIPAGAYACMNCGLKPQDAAPAPVASKEEVPGKKLGLISMILGIVSLACCNPVLLVSIAGIITGIMSMKQAKEAGVKNNQALAGIICSAIGAVFFVIFVIIYVIFIIGAGASSAYYY